MADLKTHAKVSGLLCRSKRAVEACSQRLRELSGLSP